MAQATLLLENDEHFPSDEESEHSDPEEEEEDEENTEVKTERRLKNYKEDILVLHGSTKLLIGVLERAAETGSNPVNVKSISWSKKIGKAILIADTIIASLEYTKIKPAKFKTWKYMTGPDLEKFLHQYTSAKAEEELEVNQHSSPMAKLNEKIFTGKIQKWHNLTSSYINNLYDSDEINRCLDRFNINLASFNSQFLTFTKSINKKKAEETILEKLEIVFQELQEVKSKLATVAMASDLTKASDNWSSDSRSLKRKLDILLDNKDHKQNRRR